jgi:hypothetical protein
MIKAYEEAELPATVSPRQETLLKVTAAHIEVSDISLLTVSFKFINFSLQTFLLFIPEMSTKFTSYSV